MKISVIGTGYVGLVSGVCLAEKGHSVVCVDIDKEKVENINKGIPPIYEHGLDDLLKRNLRKSFSATTDLPDAVINTDLSIIAVGTPFDGEVIDLDYIKQAAREIGAVLKNKNSFHVVVVKSTVVPGTTEDVVLPILEETSEKKAGIDFGVGMNPEFLREGEAISDFMEPDRIVLGGIDDKTRVAMNEVYSVFPGVDVVHTNNKTAEMIKYTSNSLLATLISFSNEIGNLCASLGNIDVVEVMNGVHKDRRFSPILANGERVTPGFISYLAAGCGFGGSCFPKDVKALIAHGKQNGSPMSLLESVIKINESQPGRVISLLQKHFKSLDRLKIAVLGLAFKPGTDDMRESPAIPIVRYLIAQGAQVHAYDPVARREAEKLFDNNHIVYHNDLAESIHGTQAVILLTRWDEFNRIPEILSLYNPQPLFVDGRRMLDKTGIERYEGIGL
jgi:UDPglucose 6-dehydrogenase